MPDTIMLIGAGLMGRGYVEAARALGLRSVLIEDPERRETYDHMVDRFIAPAGSTETHWLEAALAAAERYHPDGVVAYNEPHVLAAAWVAERYRLAGPSLAAADASRNKAIQRTLFANAGLPQPESEVVDTVDTAVEWSRDRYPVVVKPLRGMGSIGVRFIEDETALRADLANRDVAEQLLVETYVAAPEYSWEGLVEDGVIIFGNYTEKLTTGPPEFVELAHCLPCDSALDTDRVNKQVAALVAAAGIRSSLVHLEFRDGGSLVYPMEFALRTPGDHIMELMCRAHGHDLFSSVIELALGRQVSLPSGPPKGAGVRWFAAPGAGRISAVEGADEVSARPGVVRFGQRKHVGDAIGELRSSGDRVAHVVVAGDSFAQVGAELDCVSAMIKIRVERP